MTAALTRQDIRDILGDVAPHTLARILALGGTRDDLEQAANSPDGDSTNHVAALRELIAELDERDPSREVPSA